MHPQNKMLGSDPFYFHFIFYFFILKGAPAPSFYLGTQDGGIFGSEPKPGGQLVQLALLIMFQPSTFIT
jgi:hypothetical protein